MNCHLWKNVTRFDNQILTNARIEYHYQNVMLLFHAYGKKMKVKDSLSNRLGGGQNMNSFSTYILSSAS